MFEIERVNCVLYFRSFSRQIIGILSVVLGLAEYSEAQIQTECTNGKPYTDTNGCQGWSDITLQQCQAKCTANDVPDGCTGIPPQDCKYVFVTQTTCHLANSSCEPQKKPGSQTVMFTKTGKLIVNACKYL